MIWSIVIKLSIGLVGILFFLRLTGKTQMAKLTPLDTVNGVLMGTIIGSIVYNPELSPWYLVIGIIIWTGLNMILRLLLRKNTFRMIINGHDDLLIKDRNLNIKEMKRNSLNIEELRAKLREDNIYSLLDVDKVRFETDGNLTVFKRKEEHHDSHLLVDEGELMKETLKEISLSETWLDNVFSQMGFDGYKDIFCAEWTPTRGFYVVSKKGQVIIKMLAEDPRPKA